MPNMIQIIKQAAIEAVEASKPTKFIFGTVSSSQPLKIKIDQKITLTEEFLVLSRNVTDYETEEAIENGERRKVTVYNSLQTGEKVLLLREQGGQSYVVLDRVGEMK